MGTVFWDAFYYILNAIHVFKLNSNYIIWTIWTIFRTCKGALMVMEQVEQGLTLFL